MASINLTFTVTTENLSSRMSLVPPYNTATVLVESNVHLQKFVARITKGAPSEEDPSIGILITELTDIDPVVKFTYTINAATHFTEGDGAYQITMYALDDLGEWNVWAFFITVNDLNFITSDNKVLKTVY